MTDPDDRNSTTRGTGIVLRLIISFVKTFGRVIGLTALFGVFGASIGAACALIFAQAPYLTYFTICGGLAGIGVILLPSIWSFLRRVLR